MGALKEGNTNDVLIEYIVQIAKALDGNNESSGGGDRLRTALGRIATYLTNNSIATGSSLPAVTATNNGKVLKVVNGVWAMGDDADTVNVAANQAESEAATIAALVADFNDLLGKLKTAGLMTADAETEG